MKETVSVLISSEEIEQKINEIAEQLSKEYEGKTITLLCILKGSVLFTADISRKLTVPVEFQFMSVSSYGNGTVSTGQIKIKQDMTESIEGKDVLIIEDIIDSGRTLYHLRKYLLGLNPRSLKICTLLDKPDRREMDLTVDYNLFSIPDEFVVGYGLDYAQRYRNLPYIGVLSFSDN